jgi:hypothetical protein
LGREQCSLGQPRSCALTKDGLYRRVTLSCVEADAIIKIVHPSATVDCILKHFKAQLGKKQVHAYYGIASGGSEGGVSARDGESGKRVSEVRSLGWHSDAFAGALMQLHGSKELQIGGIHVAPVGSAGETVEIKQLPVDAYVKKHILLPNAIVGFGVRQIHCLHPCTEENLSLAFVIKEM